MECRLQKHSLIVGHHMKKIKNTRFINALHKNPVDATPIWLMRQAGRYLPEYRAVRQQAGSFMTLCKTPELACEVTLQPLRRYDLDAAIIFSDILTIPDAMGLGLHFIEGEGPHFQKAIQDENAVDEIQLPQEEQLSYVYQAIQLVHKELDQRLPLIGFCGSPWTLAAYMIQGHAKQGFPRALEMLNHAPHILHKLLDKLAGAVSQHLHRQITSGATAVMLFDTWGGLLNTSQYEQCSLFYLQKIIQDLRNRYHHQEPVILFTKNGNQWLSQMAKTGCQAIGVDWTIDIGEARERVGDQVALQGNLNPAIMLDKPGVIQQAAEQILTSYGIGSGHIFNLGHGITPDVPPENVSVLIETVHDFSKAFHQGNQAHAV